MHVSNIDIDYQFPHTGLPTAFGKAEELQSSDDSSRASDYKAACKSRKMTRLVEIRYHYHYYIYIYYYLYVIYVYIIIYIYISYTTMTTMICHELYLLMFNSCNGTLHHVISLYCTHHKIQNLPRMYPYQPLKEKV